MLRGTLDGPTTGRVCGENLTTQAQRNLDLDTTRRRLCRLLPRHECQWLPGSSIYIYTLYTFVSGSKGATL